MSRIVRRVISNACVHNMQIILAPRLAPQYRQQPLGGSPILATNEARYCPPVALLGEIPTAGGKRGLELPLMLWKKLLTQV